MELIFVAFLTALAIGATFAADSRLRDRTESMRGLRLYLVLITAIPLVSCGGGEGAVEPNSVQEQYIAAIKEGIDADFNGTAETLASKFAGRLPDSSVQKKGVVGKNVVNYLMTEVVPRAERWNAKIDGLSESDGYIIIDASWGMQSYKLFLFEDAAKDAARNLKKDGNIQFSGELLDGEKFLYESHFKTYPTEIRADAISLNQSAEGIARERAKDDEARKNENQSNALVDSCKEYVTASQRYPASVSFSFLGGEVEHLSGEKWKYTDVVKSKNGIGNVIPNRFVCSATFSDKGISKIAVKYLDQ